MSRPRFEPGPLDRQATEKQPNEYLSVGVGKVDVQRCHGTDDRDQRLDRVAAHQWNVRLIVVSSEAALVDDPATTRSHNISLSLDSDSTTAV